jgi:hypothetical protein
LINKPLKPLYYTDSHQAPKTLQQAENPRKPSSSIAYPQIKQQPCLQSQPSYVLPFRPSSQTQTTSTHKHTSILQQLTNIPPPKTAPNNNPPHANRHRRLHQRPLDRHNVPTRQHRRVEQRDNQPHPASAHLRNHSSRRSRSASLLLRPRRRRGRALQIRSQQHDHPALERAERGAGRRRRSN